MNKSFAQMFARNALSLAIGSAALGLGTAPMLVQANQQTSAIVGQVYDAQGNPAAGATVTVTDLRSGTTRSVNSNETGAYSLRNLAVGKAPPPCGQAPP